MIELFDTHCHLYSKRLKRDLNTIVNNSREVKYFLVPGIDISSSKESIEMARMYDTVYSAVGIHPENVNPLSYNEVEEIKQILQSDFQKVVAIGEVGLDNVDNQNDQNSLNFQASVLGEQIRLAIEFSKSLILHSRNTDRLLVETLTNHWNDSLAHRTVFHCCEASSLLLDFATSQKIFIGIDGDVTYNRERQDFVKNIPLDLLVLETDSPYLLPEPLKSQKAYPNKPENLQYVAMAVSQLLDIDIFELSKVTTQNALRLFNL